MKILRILPTLDPKVGGPVAAARCIDEVLLSRGHTVEVLTLDAEQVSQTYAYPAKTHALGPTKPGYRYNRRLVPWLAANAVRYDVVIVDGLWQYHSFATWRALAGKETPYVVCVHGMLSSWFRKVHPLKHLKKWLYWPWAEYRVLRDAAAVIFACAEERRLAGGSFWLYKCRELVVPFGVGSDPARTTPGCNRLIDKHPELVGKRTVLFLGRLVPIKGCMLLLEAFASAAAHDARLHLLMAGPDQGGFLDSLRRRVAQLGIEERVTWTGMLDGEGKKDAFECAEVFCLPSHHESFGMAVVEALSSGKAVLISDKVGVWQEVERSGAGIIFSDNAQGLLTALKAWISMNSSERRAMHLNATECYRENFDVFHAAGRLLSELNEVVASRGEGRSG